MQKDRRCQRSPNIWNGRSATVRQTIHRWNQNGLVGLWESAGRGKKPS
ncbi:MAG: hypothetical protein ACRC2R_15370 [Xenococcaceae cyanobacterium]